MSRGRPLLAAVLAGLVVFATAAFAGLTVAGRGEARGFDPSGFPPAMRERYALLERSCGSAACHGLGRVVDAVQTGVAPFSRTPFDKRAVKRYALKMMRKPDSGIDIADAKALVELLYYLLDEAQR